MEATAYKALAEREETGWYYRARLKAVETLIRRFAPRREKLRLIDVGCGTGGSTAALRSFGEVMGIEPSELGRQLAAERFPGLPVLPATLEELPGLKLGRFDVAVMLCVLYHQNVKDPKAALKALASVQDAGALLVWNEPAYPFLWRQHDRQTAAGRRFFPREMQKLLEECGYELIFRSHLLGWGFPLAAVLSLKDRWRWGRQGAANAADEGLDHRPLPAWCNGLLRLVTYGEWSLQLSGWPLPWGVSYLLAARKTVSPSAMRSLR